MNTGTARVLAIWRAFDRLPAERRTPSAFADALAESNPAAEGDPDAARVNWRESRRRGAPLFFGPGVLTLGDDADVLVLHMSKPECDAAVAAQVTARSERGRLARAFLRELRFEAVACFAAKRSSVTGNMIVTDKTYLELAAMPR